MKSNQIPGLTYDDGFTKGREFGVNEIRDFVSLIQKFPQVDTPQKVLEEIDDYIKKAEKQRKEAPNGTRVQDEKRK